MSSDKYYLGLDVGITSIGWAISNDKNEIVDFGVTTWNAPWKINKGSKDGTKAKERRTHRAFKRGANRKRWMKREVQNSLLKVFKSNTEFTKLLATKNNSNEVNLHKVVDYLIRKNGGHSINVYDLRYSALKKGKILSPFEISYCLLNYINHRGQVYFSREEVRTKEDIEKEVKKLKEDYGKFILPNDARKAQVKADKIKYEEQQIKNLVYKDDKRFPTEIIVEDEEFRNPKTKGDMKRNNKYLTKAYSAKHEENEKKNSKKMYDTSFYEKQKGIAKFFRESWKEECKYFLKSQKITEKLADKIFLERNFEDGPGFGNTPKEIDDWRKKEYKKIKGKRGEIYSTKRFALSHYVPPVKQRGFCTYKPDKKRWVQSSIITSIFNYLQSLESKKIVTKGSKDFEDQYQLFFKKRKHTPDEVTPFWNHYNKIKEYIQEKFIPDLSSIQSIKEFDNTIGVIFTDYSTPKLQYEELKKYLLKEVDFGVFRANIYKKTFSTANNSLELMIECIQAFRDKILIGRQLYDISNDITIPEYDKLPKRLEEIFQLNKVINRTSDNSTVFRALTVFRKQIIKSHEELYTITGKKESGFSQINLEISNGFKLTGKEKDDMAKKMSENQNKNSWYTKVANANGLIVNKENLMKLELMEKQGAKFNKDKGNFVSNAVCILSGEGISIEDIKKNSSQNGHIISSSYGINRIENRFLITRKENSNQGNQLPYQYIVSKNDKNIEKSYLLRVKKFYKDSITAKLLRAKSLMGEDIIKLMENLAQTMTNDTRHIVAVIREWLTTELIKRDSIVEKKPSKAEYSKWWKTKMIEKRNSLLQINGLTTSFLRKQLFYHPAYGKNMNESKNSGWGYSKKSEIKKITSWDHAIDGMALSLIHSPAMHIFLNYYSNAIRFTQEMKREHAKVDSSHGKNMIENNFKDGIGEYVKGMERQIEVGNHLGNLLPGDYNFFKSSLMDLLLEIKLKRRINVRCPIDKFSFGNIIEQIPLKLGTFRRNSVVLKTMNVLIVLTKEKRLKIFKELKRLKNLLDDGPPKGGDKLISLWKVLVGVWKNDKVKNKDILLKDFKFIVSTIIQELNSNDRITIPFFVLKNIEKKSADFLNISQSPWFENIWVGWLEGVFARKYDFSNSRVIKNIRKGKAKNLRSLFGSEVPIKISKVRMLEYIGSDLSSRLNHYKNTPIEEKDLREGINERLSVENLYMDRNHNVWKTSSYIGFVIDKNNYKESHAVKSIEYFNSKNKMEFNSNGKVLLISGDMIVFKEKGKPLVNLIFKGIESARKNIIGVGFNGFSSQNHHLINNKHGISIKKGKVALITKTNLFFIERSNLR